LGRIVQGQAEMKFASVAGKRVAPKQNFTVQLQLYGTPAGAVKGCAELLWDEEEEQKFAKAVAKGWQ